MNQTIHSRLLKKYDVNGPRYTSYPTALQFNEHFTSKEYHWHIQQSNQDLIPKPLSLYLHIPFCRSLCYYCGCHKIITHNKNKVNAYLESLHYEIELQAKHFDKDRKVKQIHFGGGTPTYLTHKELQHILETIAQNFNLGLSNTEMGIEIDPRTITSDTIKYFSDIGFNRVSFGIQDFDTEVQSAINRIQDQQHTLALIQAAKKEQVHSISIDLIYGLPKQTLTSFTKTLSITLDARPDRIALYNYAHMPQRISSQKLIDETWLPSPDEKLKLLTLAIDTLMDAGYQYIGMDHFALPDDPLNQHLKDSTLQRNFQGYSTHGDCDIVGFGISAISKIGNAYSQNHKNVSDYLKKIQSNELAVQRGYVLNQDDRIRAHAIQQIMCQYSIDFSQFRQFQHIDFTEYFKKELERLKQLEADGLLKLTTYSMEITPLGRLFLRNIAMIFDAHMSHKTLKESKTQTLFSKVL